MRNLIWVSIGSIAVLGTITAYATKATVRAQVVSIFDQVTLNQQQSLDRSPEIAKSTQVTQFHSANLSGTETIEQRNKQIVQQYFDNWRNKTGSIFDLLTPDATWTVSGTGAGVGTFRKQELLDQVVAPTSARLSIQIVPTVRGIWADGDMVIVLWDGEATAKDGKPYRNTYSWFFRMKDGKAIEAIAVLDSREFTNLWERVAPME